MKFWNPKKWVSGTDSGFTLVFPFSALNGYVLPMQITSSESGHRQRYRQRERRRPDRAEFVVELRLRLHDMLQLSFATVVLALVHPSDIYSRSVTLVGLFSS